MLLKRAVNNTAKKRGSLNEINDWYDICESIKNESFLEKLWTNYCKENKYVVDISFEDAVNNLIEFAQYLNGNQPTS